MKKELKELIKRNTSALKASACDFESIYNITFSQEQYVMAEDNDGFRIHKYTYGQVKERIENAANGIYKCIGETHSWIGLEMENSVDWIAAFWGILKSGNKPYLVNSRHPKNLSQSILKRLGISKVICDKKGELDVEYISLSSLEKGDSCPATFENEIAIATSATSLQESICIYSGGDVAAQILNTEKIIKECPRITKHYKGELKNLAFLPFYHIFGLFAVYFWFTFYNRTLVFLSDISPNTILTTCRRHNVTHIFAVPMFWHTVEKTVMRKAKEEGKLEKMNKGIKLCTKLQNVFPYIGATLSKKIMSDVTEQLFGESVQFCISGGSYLKQSALEFFNGIGYPMHNGYGMSEIGIASVELRSRPSDRNQNSIGRFFTSVEHRLSEDGELTVRGASLCSRRIVGETELPTEDWIKTGDIVEKDENGSYYIRGRKGDVVIGESGENINPDILEQMFNPKDAIAYSVLGLDGENGQILSMVVQVSNYLSAARISALRNELEEVNNKLSTTGQIRKFYMTYDPIAPKTAIKVGRKYLQRAINQGDVKLLPFVKGETAEGEFDFESPLASKVIEIIAQVLGTSPDKIDCDAHLMLDLGATSLQYFSILSALAKEFNITAESGDKYTYTVRDFCNYIERHI